MSSFQLPRAIEVSLVCANCCVRALAHQYGCAVWLLCSMVYAVGRKTNFALDVDFWKAGAS